MTSVRCPNVAVYPSSDSAAICAGDLPFKLAHRVKAHARIIWGAAWTHDSAYFATASRDGSIKLWHSDSVNDKAKPVCTMQFEQPVVAVAFAPAFTGDAAPAAAYTLAVGLETGAISIWNLSCSPCADGCVAKADARCMWECPVATRHCASIRRLCWQQLALGKHANPNRAGQENLHLASCGDDSCVRIFSVSPKS